MDCRRERIVSRGLGERLEVERPGRLGVVLHVGEPNQSRRPARCRGVPGLELVPAGQPHGRWRLRGRAGRRRGRDGVEHRPYRRPGSAAAPAQRGRRPRPERRARVPRERVLEDRGGRTIRIDGREGKMASPLLDRSARAPRAVRADARRRDGAKRTATADPSSGWVNLRRSRSDLDDACREGLGQPGLVTGADDGLHKGTVGSASAATAEATSSASVRASRDAHATAGRARSGWGDPRRPRAFRLGVAVRLQPRARRTDCPPMPPRA